MAKIVIYDTTELDREQITEVLADSDHEYTFIEQKLNTDTIDVEAEAIAVFVTSEVTAEHIEKMPKLKLIACRSTGFNTVDIQTAQDREIAVVNVPTYGESTVAEYAFTLLLALTRKLPETLRSEVNHEQSELRGNDLAGKTIGIIGTGHIGRKAIAIASGFGMRVVAYDAFPNEQVAQEMGFEYVPFDTLMATSDVISLHAPLTDQTRHMINQAALSKMKSTALLVNTARGELIDTKALLAAIDEKRIAGVALDVVEGEALAYSHEELALLRSNQLPEDQLMHTVEVHALAKQPNVIITPHNAFNTVEAVGRINHTTAQNILDFFNGTVSNKVTPPQKTAGVLTLVRHAQSEWNATGQWTGQRDVHLSERGFREAALIGHEMRRSSIHFDIGICSMQIRTLETLEAIINATQRMDVPVHRSAAINERDYGDYTGMNKWQVKEEIGEEQWNAVRRGWDVDVPNGETLKQVYERVEPYYRNEIMPMLMAGKNVLLVAHGNSLRALMKYVEDIPDDAVSDLEMLFGDVVVYRIDEGGRMQDKAVHRVDFTMLNEQYKNTEDY